MTETRTDADVRRWRRMPVGSSAGRRFEKAGREYVSSAVERSMLKKYIQLIELVRKWFSDGCAYRTCHYRHSLVYYGLSLAIAMLKELDGESTVKDLDDTVQGITAGMEEMEIDHGQSKTVEVAASGDER